MEDTKINQFAKMKLKIKQITQHDSLPST